MLSRRSVVSSLTLGAASLTGGSLSRSEPLDTDGPGLRTLAAARGLVYGSAASTYMLRNTSFASALKREAKLLVAEYEMKRAALEPQPGHYDFTAADCLLRFAKGHGMAFRGHTLVWHKANPPWLEEALASSRQEQVLTSYINAVVSRYRGQMESWDVVNEALSPADGRGDCLRETRWFKAFGPEYVDIAFHAAHAADPHALLVYNDWGCEGAGPVHDRFRGATLDFLERAKARGLPIGAYGMQGHLQAFGPVIDQRQLRDFLDRLRSLGLRIVVTEHDVDDSGGPSDADTRDRAVADASRRFLDVVSDNGATVAVLTWGLSDRFLDAPGWRSALRGYSPRMLPLDSGFARKPMWSAMARSLAHAHLRLRED